MKSQPPPLRELPEGKFHTITKVNPLGSLQARRLSTGGVSLYWRYSHGTQSERVLIGLYDSSAPPKQLEPTKRGFSISAAIRSAEILSIEHHKNRDVGGRPAIEAARKKAAEEQAAASAKQTTTTLKHLLIAYCDHLMSLGRQSWRNAKGIFELHIIEAFPDVAAKPAKTVTAEEFADAMRRLNRLGKGRTANKLRSYARSAYQVAMDSRTKASIPELFKEFEVRSNPVAETAPDETANKADKNPLTLKELQRYWKLIKDLPDLKGALLRLHLLTGGQRIEQFVRLLTSNIKKDYLVIFDNKGRPGHGPREHLIPLISDAKKALKQCAPAGTYALSTDGGHTPIAGTTLSGWAAEIAKDHIPNFSAKRIRSGVETALAGARISQESRGRLQSHGISGVQNRHYDGHDYLDVKREALEMLRSLLDGPARKPTTRRAAIAAGPR